MLLIILYLDSSGNPIERFLVFLPKVGYKTEDIFSAVSNIIQRCDINITNYRRQSYHNAANISKNYSNLQARIKKVAPKAVYIPCFAQFLNLVGQCLTTSSEETSFLLLLFKTFLFFYCNYLPVRKVAEQLYKRENFASKKLFSNPRVYSLKKFVKLLPTTNWTKLVETLKFKMM